MIVWVVYGDDCDVMSQWLVGVYDSYDKAKEAERIDREEYAKNHYDPDQCKYEIYEVEVQ